MTSPVDRILGKQAPPGPGSRGGGCVVAIILVLGGIYLLGRAGREPQDPCAHDSMAAVMAEDFVKKRLKAPATARFASPDRVERLPECRYRVTGHVDAQNGFGALIRSRFIVELGPRPVHGDTWHANRIDIR